MAGWLNAKNTHINKTGHSGKCLGDGVFMPRELTAENGAKWLLTGEFHEVVELECTACDQDNADCEVCSGHGSYTYRVPIGWDTIKEIYKMAVNHLAEQDNETRVKQ